MGQAAWWVTALTGREQPEGVLLQAWLRSGVALCELINAIAPAEMLKPSPSDKPFKQMENIAAYAGAARRFGVREPDMFVTVDLYDDKNFPAVVRNLHSLGRVAQQRGFGGPTLGARLASKNVRTFSQAQLDEVRAAPAQRLQPMCWRLPPHVTQAATPCDPGCSVMCPGTRHAGALDQPRRDGGGSGSGGGGGGPGRLGRRQANGSDAAGDRQRGCGGGGGGTAGWWWGRGE